MSTPLLIVAIAAALVAAFIAVAALQPAAFRIVRTAVIPAPPAVVFAQVNDFHNWEKWSPWAKLDPSMQLTIDGAPSGVGAKYAWVGNGKVGEGRMAITESRPHELVAIKLEFLKPFAATNRTEFAFRPEGRNTHLSWAMSGEKNFMSKAFGLVMNMDKMIGKDFEKGLAQLATAAEAAAKTTA